MSKFEKGGSVLKMRFGIDSLFLKLQKGIRKS